MKLFPAILFLFLLSWQSFLQCYILIDFGLNQSQIAKENCINKAKPKLHCNGKCYLSKQISKTGDKADSKETSVNTTNTLSFYILTSDKADESFSLTPVIEQFSYYHSVYSKGSINDIQHPPESMIW